MRKISLTELTIGLLIFCLTGLANATPLTFTSVTNDFYKVEGHNGTADIWSTIGLTGPGDGVIYFNDDGVRTITSASSMNIVSPIAFWLYGSTNSAWEYFHWYAIYNLNGDLGQTASISFDYSYTNDHFNAAADGRSSSYMNNGIAAAIVSAATYTDTAIETILGSVGFGGYVPFTYNQTHYFGGLTNYATTFSGSLNMGTMSAGEYLFMKGYCGSRTEAQAYAFGTTIATMVSTFEFNLAISELPPEPIPEPNTILLFCIGLLGLAGINRRQS